MFVHNKMPRSPSPVAKIVNAAEIAAKNAAKAVIRRANKVIKNAAPGDTPRQVANTAVRAANKKARIINKAAAK